MTVDIIETLQTARTACLDELAKIDKAIKILGGSTRKRRYGKLRLVKSRKRGTGRNGTTASLAVILKKKPGLTGPEILSKAGDDKEKKSIANALYSGHKRGVFKRTRGKYYIANG